MGQLEQLAQRAFAEGTKRITRGAIEWRDPPEIRLDRLQSDGYLIVRNSDGIHDLMAPWSEARAHSEVLIELKMAGNHLDRIAVERAELRRQARQVQRVEDEDPGWLGDEPLWLVASHLPKWLADLYEPVCFAPGCYWIRDPRRNFMWIAANELPLAAELIPFLMARSGRALEDFCNWVIPLRSMEWMVNMLELAPMSEPSREELLSRLGPADDPEIEARRQHILKVLLKTSPQVRQEILDEGKEKGRLEQARTSLRAVLTQRQLTTSKLEDERIDACCDVATLQRWHRQAISAVSVTDALR